MRKLTRPSGRYRDTAGNERKLRRDDARGNRAVCILNRAEITFDELATHVQGRRIDPFDVTRRMQHHRRAGNDDDADNDADGARDNYAPPQLGAQDVLFVHGHAVSSRARAAGKCRSRWRARRSARARRQSHTVQMRRAAHPSTPAADRLLLPSRQHFAAGRPPKSQRRFPRPCPGMRVVAHCIFRTKTSQLKRAVWLPTGRSKL